MSYDYTACKRSLECLFGLGALGKIKKPSAVSHRQSLGATLWGKNWVPKLTVVIGITYMMPREKVIPAPGAGELLAKVKTPMRSPIRKKNHSVLNFPSNK
ncbi:hypothetical protein TNCV_4525531 [Trichonephila clavipes]|nr:hypothetical protein TNCV_4525531 [Trichonephila clavipes]